MGERRRTPALNQTITNVAKILGSLGGQTGPPAHRSTGWLCAGADCHYAIKSVYNWPERTSCWGCGRNTAAAMSLPTTNALKPNVPKDNAGEPSNKANIAEKTLKKREARARKRKERQATKFFF